MRKPIGKKLLFGGMLIALAARLPIAWNTPAVLVRKVVSDDMFYYLLVARNMAAGRGATADGETVSNGFHFLYAAFLVPLVKMSGGDPDLLVSYALSLLTVASVLAACPLYALLRPRCSEACTLVACALWLCSPFTVLVALSGVEAPLYVLFLGILCVVYLRFKERGVDAPLSWFRCGILAALAVYARLDGAIMAAVIFTELLLVMRRPTSAAAFAGGAAAGFAPWLAWSYARTGYLLQVSGKAIRFQTHLNFRLRDGAGFSGWMGESLSQLRAGIGSVTTLNGLTPGALAVLIALVIAAAIIIAAAKRELFREWLARSRPLFFIPAYGIVTLALYAGWLWYSQDWYFYSVFFSGCVALALLADLLGSPMSRWPLARRRAAWGLLFAALIISSVHLSARFWKRGLRWWQGGMYEAVLWCRDNLPEGARVGSFNSGILAYYSGRPTVNLDGVVNPAAYEAMTRGRSGAYIREAGVRYLVESRRSLLFRSAHSGGEFLRRLVPLHRERIHPRIEPARDNVTVYEVR